MKLDSKKPLFGETTAVSGRKVVWEPTYSDARKAAIAACEKYDLDHERDFWIKMEADRYENVMHFQNLIIRYSACMKINRQLPRALQFEPAAVEPGVPVDNGVAYVYKNSAQGIFTVGEANPMNCNVSFLHATAAKRLKCRVVLENAGLAIEGIYCDVEAEEFSGKGRTQESSEEPVLEGAPAEPEETLTEPEPSKEPEKKPFKFPEPIIIHEEMKVEEEDGTVIPFDSEDDTVIPFEPDPIPKPSADLDYRVGEMRKLMEVTGTVEREVLNYFKRNSLEEFSDEEFKKFDEILYKKLQKQEKEKEELHESLAEQVVANAMKNAIPEPEEPFQLTLETAPLMDAGYEEDSGVSTLDLLPESLGNADARPLIPFDGMPLDEIGYETLNRYFGRSNAKARKFVSPVIMAEVDLFLKSAKKKQKKEAGNG